jgi:hypothetical protein
MHVNRETPAETEERLRSLAPALALEVLDGPWWFEELAPGGFPACVRADALALVRDGERWCQLVPVRADERPAEELRIWSVHFPRGADTSGFVGWLATRIKQRTGSGILVICGQNAVRGGVYDYWGCPLEASEAVLAEVRSLLGPGQRADPTLGATAGTFDGRRMRAVATGDGGSVGADTLFSFAQRGSTVWARYAGGAVPLGYLVGTLADGQLVFRYAQVDVEGAVHGGRSVCDVQHLADGRLRLLEHFRWESKDGSGTNVIEEVHE